MDQTPIVGVILPAAGDGLRFSNGSCLSRNNGNVDRDQIVQPRTPKQFTRIGPCASPILMDSLDAFLRMSWISEIVLLLPEQHLKDSEATIASRLSPDHRSKVTFLTGKHTRHRTIKKGVDLLKSKNVSVIIVHDAVRPGPEESVCKEIVREAVKHGACGVYVPLVSTVLRMTDDQFLDESLVRERYVASETPQAFRADVIQQAYDSCSDSELERGTECLALAKNYGACQVKMVPVNPNRYFKVTYEKDLASFACCVEGRHGTEKPDFKNGTGREGRPVEQKSRVDLP